MPTKIEWVRNIDGTPGETWNMIDGCSKISSGCDQCYAESIARRFAGTKAYPNGFNVTVHPERLTAPLKRRKPTTYFVNSMGDVFHDDVPTEAIVRMWAVMAATPQHTYIVLTKRHGRMRSLLSSESFVGEVRKALDALRVQENIEKMGPEEIRPIEGFPGYYVSDRGDVFTGKGSATCVWCGAELAESANARRRYCSKTCRQRAQYEERVGRWAQPSETRRRITPDAGEQGHLRVTLYRDGQQIRQLVHRLVLSAFDRAPLEKEQACHLDGNPLNNALPNLRWGTQSDNWADRLRHGNGRSYAKLDEEQAAELRRRAVHGEPTIDLAHHFGISDTQVRNIVAGKQWSAATHSDMPWPLPGVWVGVSAEDQKTAELRVPALLETPAAVRVVSAEPLLGPVDLTKLKARNGAHIDALAGDVVDPKTGGIYAAAPGCVDWVLCGGESGLKARPMHPLWARSLRDQTISRGRAYFFKQWGSWGPAQHKVAIDPDLIERWSADRYNPALVAELNAAKAASEAVGATHGYAVWADQYGWQPHQYSHKPWSVERTSVDESMHASIRRWGKHSGRELDGRIHDDMPARRIPTQQATP